MKRTQLDETQGFRTAVIPVRVASSDYQRAHDACHRAALLWNYCVAGLREFWHVNERDPEIKELRQIMYSAPDELLVLASHTKQALVDDLLDAVSGYRSNLKANPQAKAPWRLKNYRPLEFTAGYGWRISGDRLRLSLGRGSAPIWLALPTVTDPASGEQVPVSLWRSMQLCWDIDARQWSLHIAVPTTLPTPGDPSIMAAIDEGIINSMTLAHESDDAYEVTVINGRLARSIKHERNTAVAHISRLRSRCTPGSRREKKLARAEKKARARAKRRLRNFDHHVARKAAEVVEHANAGTITAGDVRGIEQRTRQADKRRCGRHQRRRLSQWSRGRQEDYLTHKSGVEVGYISEAYSSRTCPSCLAHTKPSGRNYRCQHCGFTCHRDAVGALNILQRATKGAYAPLDPDKPIRITYRRAVPVTVAARRTAENPANVVDESRALKPVSGSGRAVRSQKPRP